MDGLKSFAYRVVVRNQPRFMGTIHAKDMEDAVRRIINRDRLTIKKSEPVFRPCDASIIQVAKWMLGEEVANICVWARAEDF